MMTSWIEPYATKLELERRNEILILNIDRLDLEKQTSNNIIENSENSICKAILKTGKNKGSHCKCKSVENSDYCKRHNK